MHYNPSLLKQYDSFFLRKKTEVKVIFAKKKILFDSSSRSYPLLGKKQREYSARVTQFGRKK